MVDKSTSNLEHFIIRQQRLHPEATGEFSSLFSNITFAFEDHLPGGEQGRAC